MPALPPIADSRFLADAALMKPIELPNNPAGQWGLGNPAVGYVVYKESGVPVKLDLSTITGSFTVMSINPKTGEVSKPVQTVKGGKAIDLMKLPGVVWIKRK